jgi:hypothetical protein
MISDPKDRQLYANGVIAGIRDGKYLKGPKWDKYVEAAGVSPKEAAEIVTEEAV